MKKYVVFLVSFVLLYGAAQLLSGRLLTIFYTPDLNSWNASAGREVQFGETSIMPFVIMLVVGSVSYIFSQKLFATKKQKKEINSL